MRLQFHSTLLLISVFSTSGRAAVSCDGLLRESSFSLLAAPIVRRDKSPPSPSPAPTPTPALASKQDPSGQAKKSKNSSADTTISEDTSTPTLSTIDSTTISATSTIIVSPTPASSDSISSTYTSSITTSSTPSASTTTPPAPLSTQSATSTPSKSSVSSGLIAGVVIAILLVLAALTWVISMRRHLRQREWQFKYHERIFDGPEGLLNKKQQTQQQQKEAHEMTHPTSIVGKGPVTVAREKQLPAHPDVDISEPEKVLYGRQVKRKPAREIVFPPIAAVHPNGQPTQYSINTGENYLEQPSDFAGLSTYANLPYVHCTSIAEVEAYDIAILGAPFDTATTGRPGARFGPHGIRDGSRRIMSAFAWSAYTERNAFQEWAKIVDCGDAPLTFLDNTVALKQLESAHKATSGRKANATAQSETPRIITLGGDHTTTLAALRATVAHWGAVSVIHFDSHIDTWDPEVLGGGLSHYAGVNHGTFLHLAHEEGLILNSSIHAGIRAPFGSKKGDLRNDARCGFEIVKARDIDRIGVRGVIEKLKNRVGHSKVYISVDIDVLDPAFAPATGTAEVGGWTTRELLSILDGLEGMRVIGADVVEVAPIYDNPGETTVLAAAEVVHSLMSLMVETPVKS